jgi:large subunit ribosomal protein L10
MSRLIKERIIEKYGEKFRGVADVAVVSTQGVNVQQMTAFRGTLRAKGIRAMVVHNRLGKRALEAAGLAGISALLRGPSTLVWGGDGIVDIAKVLAAEAKSVAKMEVRGGVTAGVVLSKADIEALSRMPGRLELLGRVSGLAMGSGARVAALVLSSAGRVVGQVREYEKKAPADAAPAAGPEAAPAAPAAPAEAPPAPEAPAAGGESAAAPPAPSA